MRLSVLSPADGWHYRDLCRAASKLNRTNDPKIEVSHFDFGALAGGVHQQVDYFNLDSDAVFVRTMPAGSLEQIVFRMDLLQRLKTSGVLVVNPPKSIEAAVDKYLSLTLMAAAGLPVIETRVSQTVSQARHDFHQLGEDVVIKPIFGSMGAGILRLTSPSTADEYFASCVAQGTVILQQRFVNHGGSDLRLLVVGDRVWGMRRTHPTHWITNISRGGSGSPHVPTQHEINWAIQACQAVGASIAGVDLVYHPDGTGRILEVNAAVGWKETSRVLDTDFATIILQQIWDQLTNLPAKP